MLVRKKCPKKSTQGKSPKKDPDFLLFFSLCFSWFVGAGLKLLECVTEPESSRLSLLLLCVCQWAELPILPPSLPLGVWALERCVASLLSSCVWLPLLWPPLSFLCLSLSPISISGVLSGYLEFLWGDWILSFLSPYLSAAAPQMSSLSVIGCLWKPLGFEELCAFMCACMFECTCTCVCVCVCGRVGGGGGGVCPTPFSLSLPLLLPPFLCLLPFPDQTPAVEQSRSKRRKENLSFISLLPFPELLNHFCYILVLVLWNGYHYKSFNASANTMQEYRHHNFTSVW